MNEPTVKCQYCGKAWSLGAYGEGFEARHDDFVCVDREACDRREANQHRERIRELRRLPKDELTEGEREELRDAS